VRFVAVETGVLLYSDSRSVTVKGESLFDLFCELTPLLTGQLSLAELGKNLTSSQAIVLDKMIVFLMDAGMVRNCAAEPPDNIDEAIPRVFAGALSVLEHLSSTPLQTFLAFRKRRALLVGEGRSFRTCAEVLLRLGIESLSVCSTVPWAMDNSLIEVITDLHDKGISCQIIDLASAETAVPQGLSINAFDIIAYCADGLAFRDFAALHYLCLQHGVPLIPGCTADEMWIMGPVVCHSSRGCWVCTLRSALEQVDVQRRFAFHEHLCSFARTVINPVLARHLGSSIAFEVFKFMAVNERCQLNSGVVISTHEPGEPVRGRHLVRGISSCTGLCES
jgi:hypothetical protein